MANSVRAGLPVKTLIIVCVSVLLLQLVLLFPDHPKNLLPSNWARLPLELPGIVLLLVLARRAWARWLCVTLVLLLSLLLVLRLADLGTYFAFNRRFSPLLELHLIGDGWNLASTTIGPLEAGIVVLLALSLMLVMAVLLYRCLRTVTRLQGTLRRGVLGLGVTLLLAGGAGLALARQGEGSRLVTADIVPEFVARIQAVSQSIVDQRAFMASMDTDAVLDHGNPRFAALAGRDVVIVFIESYGRSYLDGDDFRDSAQVRLTAADATLRAAGLDVRSGWLTSPIRGGRSWLAHTTLQSGLRVSNQARFHRLISTERPSLTRLFGRAGWDTVGVMPAIQLDWPEGRWYGFGTTYDSAGMHYAGERFGYVTMPDQYTLSHFETHIRRAGTQPTMAMLALLSTHAPWTPLPVKTDWERIGNGSVFDGSLRFGEPVSWKYRARVQAMYRQSFDYTLDILADYLARYAGDALFVIVGDHQPAPIIDGWARTADVPIHVVSREPHLLERLPAAHFSTGMLPAATLESLPMEDVRALLASVYEVPADARAALDD